MIRRLLVLALLFGAGLAHAQLTEAERGGIQDTLLVGGMTLDDLKYDRILFKKLPMMPLVRQGLSDPLAAADTLLKLHQQAFADKRPEALLAHAIRVGFGEKIAYAKGSVESTIGVEVPETIRPILLDLCLALGKCDLEIRGALAKISPAEERMLIEGLPQYAAEEEQIKFDFVKKRGYDPRVLNAILARCDLARIRGASVGLVATVERDVKKLKIVAANPNFDIKKTISTLVCNLPVIISGKGDDTHRDTDSRLLIDFGGHNRYLGRHGAGVGYASVVIDLSGDTDFEVRDLSAGAGLLGVGVAHIGKGNSHFQGKSLCFGAGLAGVGVFVKEGGNDTYRATALAQGFGMQGVGLLIDTGGDDTYKVGLYGQGCARTKGFGWLVDQAGNDHYWAGGLVLNSPLFSTAHYSFAQGSGSGYREDTGGIAGGVGLLTDAKGDDGYWAETYAQAASYWFSLGSLCDGAGNDTYSGYHYCQASAMHSTSAYLFDLAGDDAYICRVGACQSIGHDYGVSFLLDRAGNDVFAARDSNPGVGSANGLAVFVDGGGENRFNGPPGAGNPARGSGSLGVFVSLGTKNHYATGLAAGLATVRELWGVAYDADPEPPAPADTPPIAPPLPGSESLPGDEEMEKVYRLATQWGVGTAAQEVRDNTIRLIKVGAPAFDWMLNHHLASADRLQIRAFVSVARAIGPAAAVSLAKKVATGTDDEVRVILQIATDGGLTDIGALIPNILATRPGLAMPAIRAAGVLRSVASAPLVARFLVHQDGMTTRAAMVALSQIGQEASVAEAQGFLADPDMPTRMAALNLIEQFPAQAKLIGTPMLKREDDVHVIMAIRLLARDGSPESLEAIALMLLDPRPAVRVGSLFALSGRCPAMYITNFQSLLKDPVPVVRAVARATKIKS